MSHAIILHRPRVKATFRRMPLQGKWLILRGGGEWSKNFQTNPFWRGRVRQSSAKQVHRIFSGQNSSMALILTRRGTRILFLTLPLFAECGLALGNISAVALGIDERVRSAG